MKFRRCLCWRINSLSCHENGSIFAKIVLESPIVNGMDMLDFDYTQPIANSQTFKVEFKYSNVNFTFIESNNEDS